ncbi:MAG: OmpH family outer membrane protein [Pseudomonadota bacterium]
MSPRRRFGALALAIGMSVACGAHAQDPLPEEIVDQPEATIQETPPNILVVDFDWVIRQSDAAQSVQNQLNEERQALQDRFADLEADLRTMGQELETMGEDVSDEEQLERRREFEQLVANTQREAQARRSILDQAFREAMDQVRDATVRAIADIADNAEAEIVLNVNQTIIYSRDRNISQQALDALNEQLPDVEVELPAQE